MEKFTVDLDAVLDEFEFHEGQANQINKNANPSSSGFFTPDTELGPFSLDRISAPDQRFNLGVGDTLHLDKSSSNQPLETRYDTPFRIDPFNPNLGYKDEGFVEPAPLNQNGEGTSSIQDIPEDSLTGLDNLDNLEEKKTYGDVSTINTEKQIPVIQDHSIQLDNESQSVLSPSSASTPLKSSCHEHSSTDISTLGSVPDTARKPSVEQTQFIPQTESLSNYIISVNTEPETAISETQLVSGAEPNLVKLDMSPKRECEGFENTLNDDLESDFPVFNPPEIPSRDPSPQEHTPESFSIDEDNGLDIGSEDYVDEKQLEMYLKQIKMENSEEKLIQENFPESLSPSPREDDSLRTGARPKRKPDTLLQDDLEPRIRTKEMVQVGEVETEEFNIPDDELQPSIGSGKVESPPPYSEVDPSYEELKPVRPLTLNLDQNERFREQASEETPDETSVSAGDPILGAPGETPSNPTGPRMGLSNLLEGLTEDQLMLGRIQPFWVPDSDSPNCMICSAKFTVVKRRHHCRACGKVLCSGCCGERFMLAYLENREERVCTPCKAVLEQLEKAEKAGLSSTHSMPTRPNPANPMEYCSRVPVSEQVSESRNPDLPSVMVPIGVLKRNGSTDRSSVSSKTDNKSVMFSDGIRPGGDLTELDGAGSEHRTLGKRPGRIKAKRLRGRVPSSLSGDVCSSRMPATGLPLVSGKGRVDDEEISVWFSAGTSVNFVLNNNLTVLTKRVKYTPINKLVWNFASRGLTSVGQDEVVILLETEEDELLPPRDIYIVIQSLYEQAGAGQPVLEMGHITVNSEHLGSNSHGGWMFIRHTFQAVTDLFLPPPPVLFGILLMRWEIPWARVFPLRLMLRLGAEFRYYPAPLVSVRGRKPVYGELGHTIMSVLSDFKNYAYTIPTVRGLVIHMSPGRTLILIPKNRHDAVSKALSNSNLPVLALGANFSMSVDSHLVAIQTPEGTYQTQAINIQHKERVVTGASFVVFNGALKSTANLTAKSSIVEDGIMVQVLPDHMVALRKCLENMEDMNIGCGPIGAEQPDEIVSIKWVDEDKAFNIGIKSVIDGKGMDGVGSLRIHCGPDMRTDSHLLRWTEVFLLKIPDQANRSRDPDPTRVAEEVARAVGVALLPLLSDLKKENLSPLAVRVSLDEDNVSYEAGSNDKPLPGVYMNNLDNELIPLIHSATSTSLVIELVFHILDQ